MTEQKTFKRSIRARMEKTGESYAAARRELLAKAEREANGATSRAMKRPSQRRRSSGEPGSARASGSRSSMHGVEPSGRTREIAGQLPEVHDIEGWWAQSLTVMYETGARDAGQGPAGQRPVRGDRFEDGCGASRGAVRRLLRRGQATRWLPDGGLSERTQRPPKGARFDWEDGTTRVVGRFDRKGDGGDKSVVALAHERIPDAESLEEMKALLA